MSLLERIPIDQMGRVLEIDPTEALTARQKHTCLAVGNLMFGLHLSWLERAPFQQLLGLRYLQTQRKTEESAQFLGIPTQLSDSKSSSDAMQRSRDDLFSQVASDNIEGQRCIDSFTHNLAYQIRDENLHPLKSETERAQYLGFKLLFSPHRPDSSTTILRQALAVYLDRTLRTQRAKDLHIDLGFSIENLNPRFSKCSKQEEAVIGTVASIPVPPQWEKASDKLFALSGIITTGDPSSSPLQIARDGDILPQDAKAEGGGNLHHVSASYETLAILDSLLYPRHSADLDAQAAYKPGKKHIKEYVEWAEKILADTISSEIIPATSLDQLKRREIFAQLLETIFDFPESLLGEEQIPLTTDLRYAQNIRQNLLRYAELVGEDEAVDDLHSAADIAYIIDHNYRKHRTIEEWDQDRFLNPLAVLVTDIHVMESIIRIDKANYFNLEIKDYFDRRTVQEALKDAVQPRISFLFIDRQKRKILLVKHKEMGIWTLPTEGLVGETINTTYRTGISQWMGKERTRLLSMLKIGGVDKKVSRNSKFKRAQYYSAVVSVSAKDDSHPIPRGKTRISEAKWVDLDAFSTFADWLPEPKPAGFSIEASNLHQRRYREIFNQIGMVDGINIPNPFDLPPSYFYNDAEQIRFRIGQSRPTSAIPAVSEETEQQYYEADQQDNHSSSLVIPAHRPEINDLCFLLELDAGSGLLKIPEYALTGTTASQLQNQLLSTIPNITVYPDSEVAKAGWVNSIRQTNGKAYYALSPAISDDEPLPPDISLIDDDAKAEQLTREAANFVALPKEKRTATLNSNKRYLVTSDTALAIIKAQLAKIQDGIIETGKIGEHDPRDIRNLIFLYRQIFSLYEN